MDAVPAWLPYIVSGLTALAFILRRLSPFLDERVDAFKDSKVDNWIFDAVADSAETVAKDINQKTADGKFTKEERNQMLANLAKTLLDEGISEFGEHYLGANTRVKMKRKLEKTVGVLKRSEAVVNAAGGK